MVWLRAVGLLAAAVAFVFGAGSDVTSLAPEFASASGGPVHPEPLAGNVRALGPALLDAAVGQVDAEEAVAVAARRLSPRQLAGQRVIYSYPGLRPPASLLALIRHGEAAGVLFFSANYGSRRQFTSVVRELDAANASATNPVSRYPLLLVTDQEGGIVRRLPGAPEQSEKQTGEIRPLAAAGAAAGRAGAAAAASLASYGLNVDLAPVLDVYRSAGDFDDQYQRSYSDRPSVVAALGARFIAAMQAAHVAATAKHFPGLGAASAQQNTDDVPVTINLPAATLAGTDEHPYPAAIAAGVRLVMLSWARYPQLGSALPAGLSATIVQGLLRGRLGFGGVTITDAISAGALRGYGPVQHRAVLAAGAGMDLILAASMNSAEGTWAAEGLRAALAGGRLSKTGFDAAVAQILSLRQSLRS